MKRINAYFEVSDNADFVFLNEHQSICRVNSGTVRATAPGAVGYAALPYTMAIAAASGTRAIAMAENSLAVALVAGASATAGVDSSYARAMAVGSLAEASAPGAVATAVYGMALGLSAGAHVLKRLTAVYEAERLYPGVNYCDERNALVSLFPLPFPTDLDDGLDDLGVILIHDFYRDDLYPWEGDYRTYGIADQTGTGYGSSIAMTGKQILALDHYSPAGMRLRDAIRHAEILADHVPNEAYEKLESLTYAAVTGKQRDPKLNSNVQSMLHPR